MGMDSLLTLHQWHRWQELLDYANVVIAKRPGSSIAGINREVAELIHRHQQLELSPYNFNSTEKTGRILLLETAELDISATYIRDQVSAQHAVDYLLPPEVNNYIKTHKLY